MTTTYPQIQASFEVHVAKEQFKFNAAHFVAFEGFRERLHGHNYTVGVRLLGSSRIGSDGYLIDFGDVKDVVKRVCKDLNEHFLCPTLSDVMDIAVVVQDDGQESVTIKCQDGALFTFPRKDCVMLPIVHATTEELAIYLYSEILKQLGAERLLGRGIHTMDINVAEAPGQDASFRLGIPQSNELDVRTFLSSGQLTVKPCLDETKCNCATAFSNQLDRLVQAINRGELSSGAVSVQDLENLMQE